MKVSDLLLLCSFLLGSTTFVDGRTENQSTVTRVGVERPPKGTDPPKLKRREIIDHLDSSKPILFGGSYNLVSEWTGKKDPLNHDQSVVYRHSTDLGAKKRKREDHLVAGKPANNSKARKSKKNQKGSPGPKKHSAGIKGKVKAKSPVSKEDDYKSPWSYSTWSGGMFRKAARCVDIPSNMSLCRGVGYDRMRVPNLLDHDGEVEAVVQSSYWLPLWSSKCHRDTRIFLCSMFAPVCMEQPIYPCRSLCEGVRDSCVERMNKHGFPWPEFLECDQFPDDTQLCIGLREDQEMETGDRCPVCSAMESMENIIDSFCNAEFVARISLAKAEVVDGDLKITSRAKKLYKKPAASGRRRVTSAKEWIIQDQLQCDCPLVTGLRNHRRGRKPRSATPAPQAEGQQVKGQQARRNPPKDNQFLIMGSRKDGHKLVLSYIQPMRRGSSVQNRALKMLVEDDQKLCSTMSG